jgi:hypothetical protein
MTTTLKHSKYWRAYVADELAAATMTPETVDTMIAIEAITLHVSNTEWLTLRLSARAGVDLHSNEGRELHGAEAVVRPARMFEKTLGRDGRWDW